MKLNLMICPASWTPDKLHGSLSPSPKKKKDLSVVLRTPSACDIKDLTKIVDDFRTNNFRTKIIAA